MSKQITTLENGMRIVTDTIPTVQTAALGVWVDVGARHEQAEENGVAHFLEHMAFKGTSQRNALELAETIEAVGGYLNAYTSREMTAYHARVLQDDVALATDLIADILQNSVFDEAEFAKERDVIIQEIGQSNDTPDDIIFDYFQELCYPNQSMGRPILGTCDSVNSLKTDTIRQFIDNNYCPTKMIFSAAGNVNHDQIVDLVSQSFTSLTPVPKTEANPSVYEGGYKIYERDLEQVHVLLGFPSASYGSTDHYTASVFAAILGGGMSSRLFQEVREKRGLVYTIYAYQSSYRDSGQFGIYAGTGAHQVDELMPIIYQELDRFAATLTEPELERAKIQLTASLMMGAESTSARCDQAARQTLLYGHPLTLETIKLSIADVTKDKVLRFAENILAQPSTLVGLGPVKEIEGYRRAQ